VACLSSFPVAIFARGLHDEKACPSLALAGRLTHPPEALKMDNHGKIYDDLWRKALAGFAENRFAVDPHLDDKTRDTRRGLTVLGRLDDQLAAQIRDFLNEGRAIEPELYYYDRRDFHLTILSIITCRTGFDPATLDRAAYLDLIKKAAAAIGPIRILFKGVTASPACVMLQGFPLNDRLATLRGRLRGRFKASDLEHSIDQRYAIETAHSTVIRFNRAPRDRDRFIQYLRKYRDYEIGPAEISRIEFVHNDWYMSEARVSPIGMVDLVR
jgi:hypothetical protein